MRRNGYLGASGQKSDPVIRSGDFNFSIKLVYYHYSMTF